MKTPTRLTQKQKQSSRVSLTSVVRRELGLLVDTLTSKEYTPFGPDLAGLAGRELASAVVVARLLKKYEVPSNATSAERAKVSMLETIKYDAEGLTSFKWQNLSRERRGQWIGAQQFLQSLFRGFKPSYAVRFPTGESALSTHGEPDIELKLQDLEHWQVSLDALPYAIRIAYGDPHLRRIAKGLFRRHAEELTGRTYKDQMKRWSDEHERDGYKVFSHMFRALVVVNAVSRMTTVPKNNMRDRVITCEPLWDMIVQLSLMNDFRNVLRRKLGYDLRSRAELHKGLARHSCYATIDLKNASNSVWMCVLEALWPQHVLKHLKSARNAHVQYEIDGQVEYHYFNMFSPMGCGLTFDVMTLTLLALGASTRFISVFGDDIIVRTEDADGYIGLLQDVGMQVNTTKTFVEGNFRESCGAFADVTAGSLITSFEFEWPLTVLDAFTCITKLQVLVRRDEVTRELKNELTRSLNACLEAVAADSVCSGEPVVCDSHVWGDAVPTSRIDTYYDQALQRVVRRYRSMHWQYQPREEQPPGFIVDNFQLMRLRTVTVMSREGKIGQTLRCMETHGPLRPDVCTIRT